MAGRLGPPAGGHVDFMRQNNFDFISGDTQLSVQNQGLLASTFSLQRIVETIAAMLQREVRPEEIQLVANMVNKYNLSKFSGQTIGYAWNMLAREYVYLRKAQADYRKTASRTQFDPRGDPIEQETGGAYTDIKAYQTAEARHLTNNENPARFTFFPQIDGSVLDPERKPHITQESIMEQFATALTNISSVVNPESIDKALQKIQYNITNYASINLRTITIDFDSRNRVPNETRYSWVLNAAAQSGQRGDVIVHDLPQNLLFIKISDFSVPYSVNFGSYYGNIRLLITEIRSQGIPVNQYLGKNNEENVINVYHFEFSMGDIKNDRVELRALNPIYIFRRPLTTLPSVTFEWYNPFELINLAPDSGTFTINYGTNPLTFTLGSTASLTTGSLVYITGASTSDIAIRNRINREQGWIATVLSATSFSIPLDTSTLPVSTESGIFVYFGNQRIFVKIEMKCLDFQT